MDSEHSTHASYSSRGNLLSESFSIFSTVEDDPYGTKHNRPNWTLVDHKRLCSINELYNRSIEFHNNDHSFRATLGIDASHRGFHSCNPTDIVLEVQICNINDQM